MRAALRCTSLAHTTLNHSQHHCVLLILQRTGAWPTATLSHGAFHVEEKGGSKRCAACVDFVSDIKL
eukprot:3270332-Alexandrium_andersonii.AAC.1